MSPPKTIHLKSVAGVQKVGGDSQIEGAANDVKFTPDAAPKRKPGTAANLGHVKITRAARALFKQNGRFLHLEEIADALGATRGALHSYFRTTNDLRSAVASEVLSEMLPFRPRNASGLAHLRRIVLALGRFSHRQPRLAEFGTVELARDSSIHPHLIIRISEIAESLALRPI